MQLAVLFCNIVIGVIKPGEPQWFDVNVSQNTTSIQSTQQTLDAFKKVSTHTSFLVKPFFGRFLITLYI